MNCQRNPRSQAASRRRGLSLIELLISLTVFVVIVGAVSSSLLASMALNSTNKESSRAMEAARSALESLKGTTFDEIFVRYNGTAADDPAGAEPSPGMNFAVSGLTVRPDDQDGFAGSIEFPGNGIQLREDVDDPELGLPRDLDGVDGVDKDDHAGDYRLLPVRVTIEWTGKSGARELELVTVLSEI